MVEVAIVIVIVAWAAITTFLRIRCSVKPASEGAPTCGSCSGGGCGEVPECEPKPSTQLQLHPGPRRPDKSLFE